MVLLITDLLVDGYGGMTRPSTELGQSAIGDDGSEPGRDFRRPFELIQVFVGRQEGILHHVFSIVCVSHVAICSFVKESQILRNSILKFPNARFAKLDCGVMAISNVRLWRFHVVKASVTDILESMQRTNHPIAG
jgi:hypothetical protein